MPVIIVGNITYPPKRPETVWPAKDGVVAFKVNWTQKRPGVPAWVCRFETRPVHPPRVGYCVCRWHTDR
jgi:hypothetical protein